MEHVVFFPAHDGSPAFRRVGTFEDAVRLVEHLRNVEGVSEVSCHALTEVPLAFRAYYRVEVPGGEVPAQAAGERPAVEQPVAEQSAEEAPVPAVAAPQVEPDAAVQPALVASNGRGHGGAKSLGFFA